MRSIVAGSGALQEPGIPARDPVTRISRQLQKGVVRQDDRIVRLPGIGHDHGRPGRPYRGGERITPPKRMPNIAGLMPILVGRGHRVSSSIFEDAIPADPYDLCGEGVSSPGYEIRSVVVVRTQERSRRQAGARHQPKRPTGVEPAMDAIEHGAKRLIGDPDCAPIKTDAPLRPHAFAFL